ncbi:MAG: hypothetical protein V2I39_03585 [Erythrobacter sp.]|jgi:hypothetical protein|nr:hypothetical protein [Erythrobacter sp.]
MTQTDRRTLLAGALAASFIAIPARAADGIAIPEGPMLLTRRIERELARGARLAIARIWLVTFTRRGRGVAVAGRQLTARVDAPVELADLAKAEEARSTDTMWPILLGEDGAILAAGEGAGQAVFAEAQLIDEALVAQLPGDLFYPAETPLRRSETLALPGGLEGTFELSWNARRAPGRLWLGEAEREIVTRVGSDTRRALETWRMEPV